MADEKRGPTAAPGGKRRRPAPTIDLKATEIASESVKPTEPVDPPAETPRAEAPPITPAEPEAPKAEPREPAAAASATARGWRPEWLDLAAMTNRMAGWRDRATGGLNGRLIAAGGAGAAAMLAIFLALWLFGVPSRRDDLSVTLAARLAIVELQVRDLALRPQPAGLDQRALADLAARVGAAEQAMGRFNDFDTRIARVEAAAAAPRAAPPPDQALTGRVAALEAATRSLAELTQRVEAAQKAPAPPAAPAVAHSEIEALAGRIASLEQTAKTIDDRIARATAATAGADKPARLAFVAVALRAAVVSGRSFVPELDVAKALAPDTAVLAPLEPISMTGLPSAAMLARELKDIAPQLAATNVSRDAGLVDRLAQNAERLVRIRPLNETAGDESGAIVARAEARAAQGDIEGALAEVTKLPDATRAGAAAWIKKAEQRIAALAAARQFAISAGGALKAAP